MIYFTFEETLYALFAMLLFGALFSVFETLFRVLIKSISGSLFLIKLAYSSKDDKKEFLTKIRTKFRAEQNNKAFLFVLDFVFVFVFFVIFILLSYVFYDGILRIYFLIFAIASHFISNKFLKKKIEFIFERLSYFIAVAFASILQILFLPLKLILKVFKRFERTLYIPIEKKWKKHNSNIIFNKKIAEIGVFFTKTLKS